MSLSPTFQTLLRLRELVDIGLWAWYLVAVAAFACAHLSVRLGMTCREQATLSYKAAFVAAVKAKKDEKLHFK